ncbi:MAG: acetylornithine deacetylase [Oceanospirillaceae bacterium]|uniref:acetylornithine deacetylase n=1 Tax=unclassified Thalassolituus TaxID=2624967 RepID=UPI000C627A94|nr:MULTISPECIES: acetylornithine deacetylase [unclassified Thalassolituus]MAX98454.1 acetylornithine deacetylase [Oceanospirillaceae bacterium]MBL35559.1 acetylornithine deacetylase [Oceanospirillaceae bacterium]MBS51156.1 acetylornithine deacetylase [Oceanospirillaceae bacterium]|tara:strand:+ start:1267 stop:2436 length:1170 start_codon:yes stop_codon:yes gene_type:complete
MNSQHQPSLLSRLEKLIATNSISSSLPELDESNLEVIVLLADWCESLGFHTEVLPIAGEPGKANMLATMGKGDGGLVLSGHTDTVPCNPDRWQSDPHKLTERDQRFYGLGTCDMKGFFALVLEAVADYRNADFKQPLMILATADEESAMSGARALAAQGIPKARYAVVGEPTSLVPVRAHKGIMMESIRLTGKAGHSSNPALGINALDAMLPVMAELQNFRLELAQNYQNAHFAVQTPTMNFGCIHGGDNPNRICGACEMAFDLRTLPGMSNDQLREELQRRLTPIAEQNQVTLEYTPLFPGVEPFETAQTSPLVAAAERLTGHSAITVNYATEAPFLQNMGIETLVLGPGSIDQAHQPDEFLEHSQIDPCVSLIRRLIEDFCLKDSRD